MRPNTENTSVGSDDCASIGGSYKLSDVCGKSVKTTCDILNEKETEQRTGGAIKIPDNSDVNSDHENDSPLVKNSGTTHNRHSPLFRQTLAASGAIFMTITTGFVTGYSATLLPQLYAPNSTIPITATDSSWIASITVAPMTIGCLLGGFLMNTIGRRLTFITTSIPCIVGWIIIAASVNVTMLLIGRFLTGLVVGILSPVTSVYIAETTQPSYRGIFLATIGLGVSVGILIVHILGTYLSWQLTAYISIIPPFMCLLLALISPDSPSYLASRGKIADSEKAFRWLRGAGEDALKEMTEMFKKYSQTTDAVDGILTEKRNDSIKLKGTIQNEHLVFIESNNASVKTKRFDTLRKMTKPTFYKPFIIMNVLFATTQLSGVNAVIFYTVQILEETLGTSVNEYLAMIATDVFRTIASVLACILLRKYGRRELGLLSGAGTAISSLFLAIFIYYSIRHPDWKQYSAIPMTLFACYIIFITIGLVPLPWIILGEIFPLSVRSVSTGLSSALCFVYAFAAVKTAPFMFTDLGSHNTFSIYGIVALAGTIILYLYLPETKNKTLQEIEQCYVAKKGKTSEI